MISRNTLFLALLLLLKPTISQGSDEERPSRGGDARSQKGRRQVERSFKENRRDLNQLVNALNEAIENGVGGVGIEGPDFTLPQGPFPDGPDFPNPFPRSERNLQVRGGFVSRRQLIHCRDTIQNFIHGHWWWPCCWKGTAWKAKQRFCAPHGIGKVGCRQNCRKRCWEWKPVLCLKNDQNIDRPDYLHGTPNKENGWCGGYLCKTRFRIPGCFFWWWPWLRWFMCWFGGCGRCFNMVRTNDGRYMNGNQMPYYCRWNWQQAFKGEKCFYCHGDRTGSLNSGDYWVHDVRNRNCWNWQGWCFWGIRQQFESIVRQGANQLR